MDPDSCRLVSGARVVGRKEAAGSGGLDPGETLRPIRPHRYSRSAVGARGHIDRGPGTALRGGRRGVRTQRAVEPTRGPPVGIFDDPLARAAARNDKPLSPQAFFTLAQRLHQPLASAEFFV
ncbi:MAG: hypothetical protein MUF79_12020 [Burkholderiales bacterium]|jgi:hypothetical protein|nr:hypothetical protein [Burkholderiales bacterium]